MPRTIEANEAGEDMRNRLADLERKLQVAQQAIRWALNNVMPSMVRTHLRAALAEIEKPKE